VGLKTILKSNKKQDKIPLFCQALRAEMQYE
jgi:hypothetical protein